MKKRYQRKDSHKETDRKKDILTQEKKFNIKELERERLRSLQPSARFISEYYTIYIDKSSDGCISDLFELADDKTPFFIQLGYKSFNKPIALCRTLN